MNRTRILNFFFLSFLFFFSVGCEKDEPKVENKPEIILTVQYAMVNTNDVHPDVFSKVYIYYGLLTTDVQHYKLNESKDGVLYHERDNSKIITPDSIGVVDINGKFSMFPNTETDKILFQIESNHYKRVRGFPLFARSASVRILSRGRIITTRYNCVAAGLFIIQVYNNIYIFS